MNFSSDLYHNKLCNFNCLLEAYQKTHRGKTNDEAIIEFDKDVPRHIHHLVKLMEAKDWESLFRYYRFTISIPKERIVDALEIEGRIIQHVLCDEILKEYFEPRLIKENCACRESKGTDYALSLVKQGLVKFLKTHDDGYCLKMDIHHYFPSIKRSILKDMLKDFPNQEVKELIFWIIDHCPDEDGLPIGNQTSQWFALYYLDKFERIIKEKYRIKYYARYMDDFIIIAEDKEFLNNLLAELREFGREKLGLELNAKTQISPLHKGISFLGWKLRYTPDTHKIIMTIDSSKKRLRNNTIKLIKEEYSLGEISMEEYNARMTSVVSHLKKGNTYNYRKKYQIYPIKDKKKKVDKKKVIEEMLK